MIVYLYDCTCDNHRVDKSAYLTQLLTLNGSMREEQDISNPSIVLELPISSEGVVTNDLEDVVTEDEDEVIVNPDSIPVFNYVFIPSLRRYYFVTAMSALPSAKGLNRLFRVSLRCDVLMSFKNDFMDLVAMVERNEFKYDPGVKDIAHPYTDKIERDRNYLNGETEFNISNEDDFIPCIVISAFQIKLDGAWLADTLSQGTEALYDLLGRKVDGIGDGTNIDGIYSRTASPSSAVVTYILNYDEYFEFARNLGEDQKSFIKSVIAFPLDLSRCANISSYWIAGWAGSEPTSLRHLKYSKTGEYSKYVYLGEYTFPEYSYEYDSPISIWNIYVPFMGKRELDYASYAGQKVEFYFSFSLADGSATLYMIGNDNKLIESCDFTLGHRVGVDSSNAQEIRNNQISMALNGVVGTLANVTTMIAGAVGHNPFMVAGGIAGETKLATNLIEKGLNNLPQGRITQQPASMAMTSPMTAYIERVHKEDVLTSALLKEEYAHIYGLPLNKPYRLSNLTGFTKVLDIHLEGLKCTAPERESIYNALRSGVIL